MKQCFKWQFILWSSKWKGMWNFQWFGELGNKSLVRKTKIKTNIINITSIPHSDKIIYHRQEDQEDWWTWGRRIEPWSFLILPIVAQFSPTQATHIEIILAYQYKLHKWKTPTQNSIIVLEQQSCNIKNSKKNNSNKAKEIGVEIKSPLIYIF